MNVYQDYLQTQTPNQQRATSKRPRDSSGNWRSKDSDRSFNEDHFKTPRRDDGGWGSSSSRRERFDKRGTGGNSSHSSRGDRSSRIQRGSRDDRSSRNSSAERYDVADLCADSSDRRDICDTPKSSKFVDRSPSDNSFKDERLEKSSSTQHLNVDSSCSRKGTEADELNSGKKDSKKQSAINAMQQCIDTEFSDNTSPFHLWYPAPVQVDGKQYTCVGQRLLHKAATEGLDVFFVTGTQTFARNDYSNVIKVMASM
jgi:hypothetical protein